MSITAASDDENAPSGGSGEERRQSLEPRK
jgi:hypothetical protein